MVEVGKGFVGGRRWVVENARQGGKTGSGGGGRDR